MLFVFILIALLFDISNNANRPPQNPVAFHKQDTQKETGPSQSTEKQSTIPIRTNALDKHKPATKSGERQPYDPRDDTPYQLYLWATIIGVGIALGALRFLIKSANAAERAADAAKKSADAILNVERAWVFASVKHSETGPHSFAQGVIEGVTTVTVFIDVVCTNEGKTPAWIIEKHLGMGFFDVIPETPPLVECQISQYEPEPLGAGKVAKWINLNPSCNGIMGQGQTMLIYGVVRYRHMFSEEIKHTTFGYVVSSGGIRNVPQFERLPPIYRVYNENT